MRPSPDLMGKLREVFGFQARQYEEDQVLSLAYLLTMRPGWYRPEWFVKAVKSFVIGKQSVQMRLLGTNSIVIIESRKNKTTWEPMAMCADYFRLGTFPSRAYFQAVPSANGIGPMRSAEKDGAIFLHEDPADALRRFDKERLLEIVHMFEPDVSLERLEERLKSIIDENANRLLQARS